jgi:hypothetical protein
MCRSFPLAALFALFLQLPSYGQAGLRDTSIFMVPITLSYSFQLPQGEMNERFGWNNNLALGTYVKFKSNYMLGLEGAFLFGNNVNDRSMLKGVTTSSGVIVDQEGKSANILLYERGYTIVAYAGKVIPIVGPNPNSGMLLKLGGGYMRHKIRIESQNNDVPALEGDYVKGYDRLTAGPMMSAFIGYQHIGNNRLVNFLFGFQMDLGFTHNLRPFNFDTGRSDDALRFDGLNGLRAGWTLPLYRSTDDRVYFH